jgi:methyl-accepting chemotaxis protein
VLAVEMRQLAKSSGLTANRIGKGLARAREVVEEQMATSIAESATQLLDVSRAGEVIDRLRDSFEDMSQYYKTRFAIVTKHNEELLNDIAETLGQIQYQDVVRQCIERIRIVVAKRNESLRATLAAVEEEGSGAERLPQQLELILGDYLAEESHHKHSTRQATSAGGDLKIELF